MNSHTRRPGVRIGTEGGCCGATVTRAAVPTGIAMSESAAGRLQAQRPRRARLAAPTAQPTKKPRTSGQVSLIFFDASSWVQGPGQTKAMSAITKLATFPVITEVVEP